MSLATTRLTARDSLKLIDTRRLWTLHRGDHPTARDELARRFLPLARRVALRYVGSGEPFDDLLQVANVGLLAAIDRFEPERGNSFASFAVPTMVGELKRYFRTNGWAVHVPRASQELALEVRRASRELGPSLGRPPQIAELAQYMERDIDDVIAGLEAAEAKHAASLDAPFGEEDAGVLLLGDTVGAEDENYGLFDTAATLRQELPRLPYHERAAVTLRVSEGLSQVEIAQRLGCSQMNVSRLMRRGRENLSEWLGSPPTGRRASRRR